MSFFMTERGTKMYYESYGDESAPTLLLIHGWFAASSFWSEQLPMLIDMGYHIVTVDLRGHGKSGKPAWGYTEKLLTRSVEELLEFLEIREFCFVGHSFGSGVALDYALLHPDQVKSLILLNTTYSVEHTFFGYILKNFGELGFKIGYHPLIHTPVKQLLLLASPTLSLLFRQPVERVEEWFEEIMDVPYWAAQKQLKAILKFDIYEELDNIYIPTLVIGGEYDFITPARMSAALADRIPNSELHIIKGASHHLPVFRGREVNALMRPFLLDNYPCNGTGDQGPGTRNLESIPATMG